MAGTINGEAATGSWQLLTGDAPESGETTSVEGLTIKYSGSTIGPQGTVTITMGVAELFDRALYDITNASEGYLDYKIESVTKGLMILENRSRTGSTSEQENGAFDKSLCGHGTVFEQDPEPEPVACKPDQRFIRRMGDVEKEIEAGE